MRLQQASRHSIQYTPFSTSLYLKELTNHTQDESFTGRMLGVYRAYASRLDFCPSLQSRLRSFPPPSTAAFPRIARHSLRFCLPVGRQVALHQEKIIKNRLEVSKSDRLLVRRISTPCLSQKVKNQKIYVLRTGRKPRLLLLLPGELLLRLADRKFLPLLFQLPPRFTRFNPLASRFLFLLVKYEIRNSVSKD